MWCFENNVYYEGQILRHAKNRRGRGINMKGCKNSCNDEGDKCTAFVHKAIRIRISRNNERASYSWTRNCTLMMNVTKTIEGKTPSIWGDSLTSGKKCKYYEPLRKMEEEGMNYPFLQLLNLMYIYTTYVLCLV